MRSRPERDAANGLIAQVRAMLSLVPHGGLACATMPLLLRPNPMAWLAGAPDASRAYLRIGPRELAGTGVAATIEATGDRRFSDATGRWERLVQRSIVRGPGAAPLALGGFAFDPTWLWPSFPALRYVVPRVLVDVTTHGARATVCVAGGPHAEASLGRARLDLTRLLQGRGPDRAHHPATPFRSLPGDGEWLEAVARTAR
ncbi:MAG: hypothetical protein FJ038_10745, partial [Chloroflexi bacterium]|nr:hypothetical protein [Chloroflexota bacterium]